MHGHMRTRTHTESRPCFGTHSPPLKLCFTGHICAPRDHATVVIIGAHDILLSQFTREWGRGISNSIEHISRLIMAAVSIYSSADSQCCGERSNFTDGTVDHVGELSRLGQRDVLLCLSMRCSYILRWDSFKHLRPTNFTEWKIFRPH